MTYSFKILIETSAKRLSQELIVKEERSITTYDNESLTDEHDLNFISEDDIKSIIVEVPKATTLEVEIESPVKRELRSRGKKNTNSRGKRSLTMTNVKKPKRLYCVECKAAFYSVQALRRHCSQNHPVKNTVGRGCECCFEKFDTFRAALLHRKLHNKPYVCEDCWEGFETNGEVASHNCSKPDKSTKEGLKQCDQCGKSYKPGYIRIHMLTHNDERTYSCKQCPKKFKVLGGLHSHIQWAHKRVKNHKCEFCNTLFISSSARCAHIRKIHLREKKHVCKCGKGFFSKSELERHMLTHTGVKNFHCHLCEKSYQTRHGLNVHLRSHSQINNMNIMNL